MAPATQHAPHAAGGQLPRLAGTLFLAGAVLTLTANIAHPVIDQPNSITHFYDVHTSEVWVAVHIGLMLGLLLTVAALVTLQQLIAHTIASAYARVGSVFAIIGGTMLAISLGALDGYALSAFASDWQQATGAQQETLESMGTALITIDHGILSMGTLSFLGVSLGAHGTALLLSRQLPRWLGWTTAALGAAGIIISTLMLLLGPTGLTINTLFRPFAALTTLLFIALGIALWRQTLTRQSSQRAANQTQHAQRTPVRPSRQ